MYFRAFYQQGYLKKENLKNAPETISSSFTKTTTKIHKGITFFNVSIIKMETCVALRPLRRAIQRYLEDELSDMILKGELKNGQKVLVSQHLMS